LRSCVNAVITIGPRQIDRDCLEAPSVHWLEFVAVLGHRLAFEAEHARDRGAVDVGVEQADALAELFECDGEIDGNRRLADTALAARHGDDGADAFWPLRLGCSLGSRALLAAMRVRMPMAVGCQNRRYRAHARQRQDRLFASETQRFFYAALLGRNLEGEADMAVFDGETLDQAGTDDIAFAVVHVLQSRQNLVRRRYCHILRLI
jgi:hypothetical protein